MTASVKTKQFLWKRDGGRCFYCGVKLQWKRKTIDHVIPKSKGGPHRSWNLVISCFTCNKEKADSFPKPEHLDIVLRRKVIHESRISIGQAIEIAKNQDDTEEAERLIALQEEISNVILKGSIPAQKLIG